MARVASVLAPILRSETQARLLATVLLQSEREFTVSELAQQIGSDPGNVSTEVDRLVRAGILGDRRIGRARLVRDAHGPLNDALANLLEIGYGPRLEIEKALRGLAGIDEAFIVGSWARRHEGESGPFPRDIDVVVVGRPDRDDVVTAVEDAVRPTGQQTQVVFRTPEAWRRSDDSFTKTVKNSPLVPLRIGRNLADDDIDG